VPTIRERAGQFHAQVRMNGFPTRTASFPTRRLAERWAKTIEADMIEGRHFRGVEARRRTLAEAIDRYLEEELPKKRNGSTHRSNLPWRKKNLGHLKLADVTRAILVEYRGKLSRESFTRANPKSARTTVKKGELPNRHPRSPATVHRYLAALSHVFTVARKEWHWVSHNPFDGVGKLSEGRGRVRFSSEEERTALLRETTRIQYYTPSLCWRCQRLHAPGSSVISNGRMSISRRGACCCESRRMQPRGPPGCTPRPSACSQSMAKSGVSATTEFSGFREPDRTPLSLPQGIQDGLRDGWH
jgi:hypothetical protein